MKTLTELDPTRKAGQALLVLFLVGFLAILGISFAIQKLIDDLDAELTNQRAHLFIGEQIVTTINEAERLFLAMSNANSEAAYRRHQSNISKAADQLEQHLDVLQHGGTVRQQLALNLYGIDEMVREVRYTPSNLKTATEHLEVIEIAPFIDGIRKHSSEALELLMQRDLCASTDTHCISTKRDEVSAFYKQLQPYFFRLGENANRQFYETADELKRLEQELHKQQDSLRYVQLGAALLVMASVLGMGRFFTRRISQAHHTIQLALTRAEQANQAKTRFLAIMSHEVRTPMNGILGVAQALQMPGLTDAQRKTYLGNLMTSGNTLMGLLNDILDMAQVESGGLKLHPTLWNAEELLSETVALFLESANGKGLQLRVQPTTRLTGRESSLQVNTTYIADVVRLRQMLSILIGNAIKFTPRGEVTPAMREMAMHGETMTLEFAVTDTGIGIPEDKQKSLFQSFSQVDDTATRKHDGAGLGLAIVRNLAELMNGSVGLDSTPGKGSRFWFQVQVKTQAESTEEVTVTAPTAISSVPPEVAIKPIGAAEAAPPTVPEPTATRAPAHTPTKLKGHVLVAEDHPLNRVLMNSNLTALGITARVAEDGKQALDAYISGEYFDCVLMDVRMPEMDGLEATRAIRRWEFEHHARHCPIMAVTANTFDEDRIACAEAGMDDFLPKPVTRADLHAKLAQWLQPAD